MTEFRKVSPTFSVSPQVTREEIAAAARAGFRTIINNRPDGEAPDQIPGAEAETAAQAAGLAYRAIPITQPTMEAVAATEAAIAEADGPILAFCRSGTRSVTLWALAQAKARAAPPADLIAAAAEAGYDLSPLRARLSALYEA